MKRALTIATLMALATGCSADGPAIISVSEPWFDSGWDTGPDEVDVDGDGAPEAEDCDDEDPLVFPGADELCNDGADNDCDGDIDADDDDCA